MIVNYLKIALRVMSRHKSFSIINIAGLSIGLVSFLAISLYVVDEFSYDRFHEHRARIHRAIISANFDGQVQKWGAVPNAVAPVTAREIPEVEKASRLFHHNFGDIGFISTGDEKFAETELYYADPEIFDIFTIELTKGTKKAALAAPGTVILSESAVKRYFGDNDPIGKQLQVDNRTALEVTGVFQDFPANSILKCKLIASFSSSYFGKPEQQSWGNASFDTFFLLHEGVSKKDVDVKIEEMLARNIPKDESWFTISLQPLDDIHLYSGDLTASIDRKQYGDINQIRILTALGAIILIIASINYMNLTTAQSQRRNKEVGISKTLGANGLQLKSKFYFETSLLIFLAILVSVGAFLILLPQFNSLTGKAFSIGFLGSPAFLIATLVLWVVLTFFSGFYPAHYLSSFSPKSILQQTPHSRGQAFVRKTLVVIQFSSSVVLMVAAIVFVKQMNFIRDKKLGYQPEQVIAVMISAAKDQNQVNSLKTEFESIAEVVKVAKSQSYPGIGTSGYTLQQEANAEQGASIMSTHSSSEILDVLGIKLLAGKSLPDVKTPEDTTIQVVLNKSAVDYLHLTPEEAIGQHVYIYNGQPSEVVGVTEDFHFASLHQQIGPYCFTNNTDNRYTYLLVKVSTGDLQATIAKLSERFENIVPAAFEYTFLDEQMNAMYQAEDRLTQLVLIAAGVAIFIACLGLYSLAAYSAEQRIKEIGIRKVLGASVPHLVTLLSKDFMALVLVAFVIGLPCGYYLMTRWLEGFAYRISPNAVVFILAGVITASIAWITVSIESLRAALSNPVKSLKSE